MIPRLEGIREQLTAAAKGPWETADDPLSEGDWMVRQVDYEPDTPDDVAAVIGHESTAEFIAAAPSNVAALLAALDAVEDVAQRLEATGSHQNDYWARQLRTAITTALEGTP